MIKPWYSIKVEKFEEGDNRDEYQTLKIGEKDYKLTEGEEGLSQLERNEIIRVVKKLIMTRSGITSVSLEVEVR